MCVNQCHHRLHTRVYRRAIRLSGYPSVDHPRFYRPIKPNDIKWRTAAKYGIVFVSLRSGARLGKSSAKFGPRWQRELETLNRLTPRANSTCQLCFSLAVSVYLQTETETCGLTQPKCALRRSDTRRVINRHSL